MISIKLKSEETIRPLWIDELYTLGQILRYESSEREVIIYADNTLCIAGKFLDCDEELIQSLGVEVLRPMKNGGNPDVFHLRGDVRLVVFPGSALDRKPIDESPCSVAQCVVRGPHMYHRLAPSKLFANEEFAGVNAVLEKVGNPTKVLPLDQTYDEQRLRDEHRRNEEMKGKILQSLRSFTIQHGRPPKVIDFDTSDDLPSFYLIVKYFGKFSMALSEANLPRTRMPSVSQHDIRRCLRTLEELGVVLVQEV